MFFEKPVATRTTASETGVLARPIGRKEPGNGSPGERFQFRTGARTYARMHTRNERAVLQRDSGSPSMLLFDKGDNGSVGPVAVVRGRASASRWWATGVARHVFPPRCRLLVAAAARRPSPAIAAPFGRDRAARSYVTSATPPRVVNTKHGRRTDIR